MNMFKENWPSLYSKAALINMRKECDLLSGRHCVKQLVTQS
jgi:hypothetical protein